MKFCSFDIETGTLTPNNENPNKYRPLGIACAATQLVDTDLGPLGIHPAIAWANFSDNSPDPDTEMYGPKMSAWQVCGIVEYLASVAHDGYVPLTWNGFGFDFDILAEETFEDGHARLAAQLALSHYDMAFQMLCSKGYMVGMQAAAQGMGLKGKEHLHGDEGDGHGELAPVLWAKSRAFQDQVLTYVKQDVQTTSEIAINLIERRELHWMSKSGRPNVWRVNALLNVQECLRLPLPDTSWMSDPRQRSSYYHWLDRYEAAPDV